MANLLCNALKNLINQELEIEVYRSAIKVRWI